LEDHRPNFLCNYLYELAGCYTAFYEHCTVLKSEGHLRASRLLLCLLTRRVLNTGLASVIPIGCLKRILPIPQS